MNRICWLRAISSLMLLFWTVTLHAACPPISLSCLAVKQLDCASGTLLLAPKAASYLKHKQLDLSRSSATQAEIRSQCQIEGISTLMPSHLDLTFDACSKELRDLEVSGIYCEMSAERIKKRLEVHFKNFKLGHPLFPAMHSFLRDTTISDVAKEALESMYDTDFDLRDPFLPSDHWRAWGIVSIQFIGGRKSDLIRLEYPWGIALNFPVKTRKEDRRDSVRCRSCSGDCISVCQPIIPIINGSPAWSEIADWRSQWPARD